MSGDLMEGLDLKGEAPRCTARARSTGKRCGNRPIPGGTVCRIHGGGAPAVRRKARLRLAELVDPAIATIARIMVSGAKDADKLRAAEAILDRAGFPRAARIEGTISLEEAKAQLYQRLLEIREHGELPPLAAPLAPLEVVDAEVIDDAE